MELLSVICNFHLLLHILFRGVYSQSFISSSNTTIYHLEGQSATLSWNINSNEKTVIQVTWFHNNNWIATKPASGQPSVLNAQYQVSGEATLTISNVQTKDYGEYDCRATFSFGLPLAITVKLIVVVKPKIILKTTTAQILSEGASLRLLCVASGKPQPSYTWYKDNIKIQEDSNNSNFTITSATRNDAGRYRCEAVANAPTLENYSDLYNVQVTVRQTKRCECSGGTCKDVLLGFIIGALLLITCTLCIYVVWLGKKEVKKSGNFRRTFLSALLGSIIGILLLIICTLYIYVWLHNKETKESECYCRTCGHVLLVSISGVLLLIICAFCISVVWLQKKGKAKIKNLQRTSEDSREVYESELVFHDDALTRPDSCQAISSNPQYMDLKETRAEPNVKETNVDQRIGYESLNPSTICWEVARDHVAIEKIIGEGAFGQVARGTVKGLRGRPGTTTVAIKMLKSNAAESDKRDLMKELDTMKQLKGHPHVIKLLGCVSNSEPLLVLMEYVPFGDLLGYLRKSRGLNDTYFKDPDIRPQTDLTSQQLRTFAWQIADGMCYLSSKCIIHRDLAARNVLIGENETCKVTDFGMARNVEEENIYQRKSKGRLPVKWTAHEALFYGKYTTQSDVWSCGVVLYETFTIGGSPYPRINGKKLANLLQEGYRMPKPQHVDDDLYEIMLRCWQDAPEARPTFTDLRNQLKSTETYHKVD